MSYVKYLRDRLSGLASLVERHATAVLMIGFFWAAFVLIYLQDLFLGKLEAGGYFGPILLVIYFFGSIAISVVLLEKRWQRKFNKFARDNGLYYQSKPDDNALHTLTAFGISEISDQIENIFIGEWNSVPLVVFHTKAYGGEFSWGNKDYSYDNLGIFAFVDLEKVSSQGDSGLTREETSRFMKLDGVSIRNGKVAVNRKRTFTSSYYTPKAIASFMDEVVETVRLVKKSKTYT